MLPTLRESIAAHHAMREYFQRRMHRNADYFYKRQTKKNPAEAGFFVKRR